MGANDLLFVYGTLKRGGENHPKLAVHRVRFVGEGRIRGRLYRIKGQPYPGAVPGTSRAYIHGEVYELSNREKVLTELDQFEGTDEGLFVRKLVDVWVGSEKFKAWVYFYARPKERTSIIPGGCFPVQAAGRKPAARRSGPPEQN
jgi:gamma-glutamylcyclotransferase (GGCT)/AIG2-like uncharacterized protein YtfP